MHADVAKMWHVQCYRGLGILFYRIARYRYAGKLREMQYIEAVSACPGTCQVPHAHMGSWCDCEYVTHVPF